MKNRVLQKKLFYFLSWESKKPCGEGVLSKKNLEF